MLNRPWMTALEMQFGAMGYIRDYREESTRLGANLQLHMLKEADAYAWSLETFRAVLFASKTIPGEARLNWTALPSRAGWCWFGMDGLVPFPAMLWSVANGIEEGSGPELLLTLYGPSEDSKRLTIEERQRFASGRLAPYLMWPWKESESIQQTLAWFHNKNNERNQQLHRELSMRFLLAACAWLQQRIVTISRGVVERHRRKQLAREHEAPLPSDVKVIQLRRLESPSRLPSAGGELIDWSCRWIVNGHWRNQPYKEDHKLIYIMPFVKGPSDKPLKVPTHTVYQVSR